MMYDYNDPRNTYTDSTTYQTVHYTPAGDEQPTPPQNKRSSNKRMFVGILCACLLSSSVVGFGGGYLAASTMNNFDKQATSSVSQLVDPGATVTNTPPSTVGVMTVSRVVSAVSDSVVEITSTVEMTGPFMRTMSGQAAGSGVIFSQDGYIITNNHVVSGATEIQIRLKDGTSHPAKLIGTDAQTDIAVLKIEATGLTTAQVGSSSALQAGDDAIAIGNPLGELGGTVTNGIISSTGRDVTIDGQTMHLLQTNAAINPGNSGGGLFDNQGRLIGIVVAKSAGEGVEGLGFAIPIDTAMSVASDLIQNGYVTGRGQLGVSVLDITSQQDAFRYRVPQLGVYISNVQRDSAAALAGLEVGDGITAVGDQPVTSAAELQSALGQHRAGDSITLTILRDAQTQNVSVTLQEQVPENVQKA